VWVFWGLIIGARIGYILFYNLSYYLQNPLEIVSPFNLATGEFVGIYGMSYHGGFLGVLLCTWIFSRRNKISLLKLINFVVPAIPAGYFFGRIGNFLNGELYGRVTEKFWGMYFSDDILGALRHPSQLYEAFFEGIVLFLILWKLRNREKWQEKLFAIYILGYGFFRFGIEFFREPDLQIGYIFGFFTLGQILSGGMFFLGIILFFCCGEENKKVI
jgi:phosphatidylglycerol:prolipoprotein diacylglycerol transferase